MKRNWALATTMLASAAFTGPAMAQNKEGEDFALRAVLKAGLLPHPKAFQTVQMMWPKTAQSRSRIGHFHFGDLKATVHQY